MWSNSFNDYEPSQLSQVNSTTSHQVFGSPVQLSQVGYVIQHNFQQPNNVLIPQPHFQYQAWSNSTEPVNYPIEHAYVWNPPVDEQTHFAAHPQHSVLNAEGQKFEGKSVVITKIHNLRSENVTLDEEIEEQKNRNSLLMKRIADAKEELRTIQQDVANLHYECQSMDESSKRFSEQLDEEKRKLSETVAKKRNEISEIKGDANFVKTLREEKDRSVADIVRLREDLTDADIDVDNLTIKFQYELGKMVIFPFWKLEEEIDKSLGDMKFCVHDGREENVVGSDDDYNHQEKPASDSKVGPAENSKENSLEVLEEKSEENSVENSAEDLEKSSKESLKVNTEESSTTDEASTTSQITVIRVNIPAEDNPSVDESSTLSVSASIHSSPLSVNEDGVETGCEFVEDLSVAHKNDALKKPATKIRKSSRFVRWLRRLSCIPKGNKDE